MHVSSPFQTSLSAPLATSTNVSTTNKSFAMYSHRNDYLPSTNSRFGWFRFSSWRVGPWLKDYWRTLYSVRSKSEFSSRVCLRSPPVLLRMCIAVLPSTCTEHRNITWHIERLSLVTNTWMRLPNLRRSEIDYKFSIVYAWHLECTNHPDSSLRAKNGRNEKCEGKCFSSFRDRAFSIAASKLWNAFPSDFRNTSSLGTFKSYQWSHCFKFKAVNSTYFRSYLGFNILVIFYSAT